MTNPLFTVLCGAALMLSSLSAQPVAKRNSAQEARIRQGVRSGSLTPAEAVRLDRQQDRVEREIRRDRIDGGVFTPAERREAQMRLDNQSRRIATQKHDAQTARRR